MILKNKKLRKKVGVPNTGLPASAMKKKKKLILYMQPKDVANPLKLWG